MAPPPPVVVVVFVVVVVVDSLKLAIQHSLHFHTLTSSLSLSFPSITISFLLFFSTHLLLLFFFCVLPTQPFFSSLWTL